MNIDTDKLKKISTFLIILAAVFIVLQPLLAFIFGLTRIILLIGVAAGIAYFVNKSIRRLKKSSIVQITNNETQNETKSNEN